MKHNVHLASENFVPQKRTLYSAIDGTSCVKMCVDTIGAEELAIFLAIKRRQQTKV